MIKFILTILLCLLPLNAWAGFPRTTILDNFNRADEGPTMTGWSSVGPYGEWKVLTNQCVVNSVSTYAANNYNTIFDANEEVYATVVTLPGSGSSFALGFRFNTSTFNGYDVAVIPSSSVIRVNRLDAGVATQLGTDISQVFSAGDVLGARMVGDTITVYVNGVSVAERTDSTHSAGGVLFI